ncbi:flavodoxin [Variovorax sp. J22R24]|uniref:flavodoxin family protein n=1 Tax=Variovorax gracilis TaxID=3053502 RepID=UPI0025753FF3|nr:flavodoxin [Variovorax sp. J22R24]MDM0107739.1 flavodoxin [Variovorax sp. J22R24]
MSKILVVVYSHTGTSRRVAELLCSQRGWRMAEIVDARRRSGVFGNLRCLCESLFKLRPAIRYDGPLPHDFDAVVLVSPIWALQLAGPMRSFVERRRDHLPDVAVVSVMGGQGAPNAVAEIARLTGRTPLLSTAFTVSEVDDGSYAARLEAFGVALNAAKDSKAVVQPVTLSPQTA